MPRYLAITALVTLLSSNGAMAQQSGEYRSPLHETFAHAIELCNSLGWSSVQCQSNRASVEEFCGRGSPGWCELADTIRDDAARSPFPHQQLPPETPGAQGAGAPAPQPPLAVQDVAPPAGAGPVTGQPLTGAQPLSTGSTATGTGASGTVPPAAGQDGRTFQDVLQGLSSDEN